MKDDQQLDMAHLQRTGISHFKLRLRRLFPAAYLLNNK